MEEDLDSILCLIDELKSEDYTVRLHAISNLEQIATAIGDERTREELVPYLTELLEDDNQEVLLAIAVRLGDLSKHVGGAEHMACLLSPLHNLASNEESTIQEKAIESLNRISSQLPPPILEESYVPLIQSLATSDWYSARIASCSLFHIALPRLSSAKQNELSQLFVELAKDDTPMVRRSAASNLGKICQTWDSSELTKLFDVLSFDDHDSVKQMTLESVLKILPKHRELISILKKYSRDKSWRIRYAVLENLNIIIEALGTAQDLLNEITSLLSDSEPEVKCIALLKLEIILPKVNVATIETQILPAVEKLTKDTSLYVKLSLMQAICKFSTYLGDEKSIIRLLPVVAQLVKDDSYEVRMSFAENIQNFNAAIGQDKILLFSVPLLMQLMNDQQWRVRMKVIECLPQLAGLLGVDKFSEQIAVPMMKWVEDTAYSVREAVLEAISQITGIFGSEWTKIRLAPVVMQLSTSPVFNKRMTAIRAVRKFTKVIGLDESFECLKSLANDKVPNVRFNVAKTLKDLAGIFENKNDIRKLLGGMKNDPDADVRFFAEDTLRSL
ncbi:unnamed protein product [Blepharisma stoltei]|uniref:Phosphatase 2A Regulatory Subunit A helical domain-containing protein n=1 Tax=Blepharisma stoltei TaxID=1481888 RepID=A0AAU9IVQ1_9CILI|nr:unnamed protein product [Blepharisma stoltei]